MCQAQYMPHSSCQLREKLLLLHVWAILHVHCNDCMHVLYDRSRDVISDGSYSSNCYFSPEIQFLGSRAIKRYQFCSPSNDIIVEYTRPLVTTKPSRAVTISITIQLKNGKCIDISSMNFYCLVVIGYDDNKT